MTTVKPNKILFLETFPWKDGAAIIKVIINDINEDGKKKVVAHIWLKKGEKKKNTFICVDNKGKELFREINMYQLKKAIAEYK